MEQQLQQAMSAAMILTSSREMQWMMVMLHTGQQMMVQQVED